MKAVLTFALLAAAASGFGCSGHYANAMKPVHQLAREGLPEAAWEEHAQLTRGTDWDELLVALDEGALLHRAGRYEGSAHALNRAIALANERETVRLSEELLGRAPFRMANHEKQALHALQALNYLKLGRLDDALVEARLTDLRQTKLQRETESSRSDEVFMLGTTVEESQRLFFEQLSFGRYISGVAWELEGKRDEAFIDYHRAYQLMKAAPADARVNAQALAPVLLRLGRELSRPEMPQLERELASAAESPLGGDGDLSRPELHALERELASTAQSPLGDDGELVVVVEAGFAPEVVLIENRGYQLAPLPPSLLPGYVVVDGATKVVPQPQSSVEELAVRRRYQGVLLDRERSASIGINTALALTYFVLFPVAMPLILKRAHESSIRMGQSWLLLPAEFRVARIRLRAGRHVVQLPSVKGFVPTEVEIKKGKPSLLLAFGP